MTNKLRCITSCLFLLCVILFLNTSYSFAKKLEIMSINAAINKNMESKNVFDEIYFKNAPDTLKYELSTTASMVKTGCVSRRPYYPEIDFSGITVEDVDSKCFWSEKIEGVYLAYYLNPEQFNFLVVFLPNDTESKNTMFSFFYYANKKFLEINYFHEGLDEKKIVDSYKFGKIPASYYEKYNLSRDELAKTADDILYNHFLPMYFDKNKENGGVSKFSMENLGEFAVDYRF